jgi:hypothetical protein
MISFAPFAKLGCPPFLGGWSIRTTSICAISRHAPIISLDGCTSLSFGDFGSLINSLNTMDAHEHPPFGRALWYYSFLPSFHPFTEFDSALKV